MAITRRQLLKRGSWLAASTPLTLNLAFAGDPSGMSLTGEEVLLYGENGDIAELGLAFRERGFTPSYAGTFFSHANKLKRGKWIAGFTDEVGLLMLTGALQGGQGRLLAVGRHGERAGESEHWLQDYVESSAALPEFAIRQPDGKTVRWHLHCPSAYCLKTSLEPRRWQDSLGRHYAQLATHAVPAYAAGRWQSSHAVSGVSSRTTISFLART